MQTSSRFFLPAVAVLLASCGGGTDTAAPSSSPDNQANMSATRSAVAPSPLAPIADAAATPPAAVTASTASGMSASVAPAVAPLRTGGTAHTLISNWTGKGFQLLTTAPPTPTWRGSPHAGSVWDNERRIMWVFGAETHGTMMDNAVYGWRADDGMFIKHYDADPSAGYRMDASGIYWSSEAKNRPWAMHTYRRMRWVAESSEIEVVYDPQQHAGITPILENPAMTTANRKPVLWYYNVATGNWRHASFGQSAKLPGTAYTFPVGWAAGYGWYAANGTRWYRLSPEGAFVTTSVYKKTNTQYHSYSHASNGVAYQVGGNASTILYSKHPLNDVTQSQKFLAAAYPALTGFSTANMASVMMPNGKIVIFPRKSAETHAMILDPVANTVTATGHWFGGMDKTTYYELAAEWSNAHQAVIFLSRRFATNRVYGYRP